MYKASDITTGPELLELLEDLERNARHIAQDWHKNPYPVDPDRAARYAKKWAALAQVLGESRNKIYAIVKDEIHNESCGG